MSISVSRQELLDVLEYLNDTLRGFIQGGTSDMFYFYGHEPVDAIYVMIGIDDIKEMLDKLPASSIRDTFNTVYISGKITNQDHVFLYGRT